ncbi:hypothetical protein D477_003368 [Arthrobacter crystallopoietes BAB-32]|uniref:Uncharacterized protein n=1 Tax=Arthrobacter crystallopoietes BAB-32 TaxID=1246476 RepID=N1V2Q0_9MICC|nr:hypothetical protein D477_003368 [Arthrobacter crystallopoietes BAB-32]
MDGFEYRRMGVADNRGPQEQTRSTYSRPSASVRCGPAAETITGGVPPTEPKARTGEFTPPGISLRARLNSSSERVIG